MADEDLQARALEVMGQLFGGGIRGVSRINLAVGFLDGTDPTNPRGFQRRARTDFKAELAATQESEFSRCVSCGGAEDTGADSISWVPGPLPDGGRGAARIGLS